MKLALLSIFLALPVCAEDKQPEPTIAELKAELASQKQLIEDLTRKNTGLAAILDMWKNTGIVCLENSSANAALKALDAPKQKGPGK